MPALDRHLALAALADLPRTGWLQAGLPPGQAPESVAAHSQLVALLVLDLAPAVEPPLDVHRATAIAVAHDAAEAWTGDLPRPASAGLGKPAKEALEAGVFQGELPGLAPLAAEYRAGSTREGRFVRAADKLQMALVALRLTRAGHRGLDAFRAGAEALDLDEFPVLAELRAAIAQGWPGARRSAP